MMLERPAAHLCDVCDADAVTWPTTHGALCEGCTDDLITLGQLIVCDECGLPDWQESMGFAENGDGPYCRECVVRVNQRGSE